MKHILDNTSCYPRHLEIVIQAARIGMGAVVGMIVVEVLRMYTW